MDSTPIEIRRVEGREVHVTWADGHRSVYGNKQLREACPCAGCVDELTGKRTLDPRSVRADIRADDIGLVGRYAVRFGWSDGHGTGIYTFQRLRAGCPCETCHGQLQLAPTSPDERH
jgi:ATP-binding protein involved in chromosome partitioning